MLLLSLPLNVSHGREKSFGCNLGICSPNATTGRSSAIWMNFKFVVVSGKKDFMILGIFASFPAYSAANCSFK